jgi:hypothetical protein
MEDEQALAEEEEEEEEEEVRNMVTPWYSILYFMTASRHLHIRRTCLMLTRNLMSLALTMET